jgi:hypothetical protein
LTSNVASFSVVCPIDKESNFGHFKRRLLTPVKRTDVDEVIQSEKKRTTIFNEAYQYQLD